MAARESIRDYRVWLALPDGRLKQPVADFRLETDERGRHRASGLRYRQEWLSLPQSWPLNPAHAPLQPDPVEWVTREIPALLDEVLPGQWERAVRRQYAGGDYDIDDLHAMLSTPRSTWRVGAMEVLPLDMKPPPLASPLRFHDLEALAREAERITQFQHPEVQALARMQDGSSVGGARPKVLVEDDGAWLVKFNRADDAFDHARVEHACLLLAARAGIAVPESQVVSTGRSDALAVRRFDVTAAGGRNGLISANALLKDRDTQADPPHPRYNDLVELIRIFGTAPRMDLAELYARMLFNECINNRDDHLKNFSFLQGPERFTLSPAYDLVPSEARGAWPQLGFDYAVTLPKPGSESALKAARAFQLTPSEAQDINDRLREALADANTVMEEAGLAERERRFLAQRLCL